METETFGPTPALNCNACDCCTRDRAELLCPGTVEMDHAFFAKYMRHSFFCTAVFCQPAGPLLASGSTSVQRSARGAWRFTTWFIPGGKSWRPRVPFFDQAVAAQQPSQGPDIADLLSAQTPLRANSNLNCCLWVADSWPRVKCEFLDKNSLRGWRSQKEENAVVHIIAVAVAEAMILTAEGFHTDAQWTGADPCTGRTAK
jgi:hypothetical protein